MPDYLYYTLGPSPVGQAGGRLSLIRGIQWEAEVGP